MIQARCANGDVKTIYTGTDRKALESQWRSLRRQILEVIDDPDARAHMLMGLAIWHKRRQLAMESIEERAQ